MRKRVLSAQLTLAAVGGLLTVASLWASYLEGAPFLRLRTSETANVLALAAGEMPLGLSIQSQQLFLQDCRQALKSFAPYTQPAETRDALFKRCLSTSNRIVALSPSFSVAWLTGALAAAQLRDWEGANARLVRSQVTGPSEQWIAQLRVELAANLGERLTEPAMHSFDEDLRLLLGSYEGIRTIAQYIVDDPEFRERIMSIAQTFPPDEQARIAENISRLGDQVETSR